MEVNLLSVITGTDAPLCIPLERIQQRRLSESEKFWALHDAAYVALCLYSVCISSVRLTHLFYSLVL